MKNWRFSTNISLYFENGTQCGHSYNGNRSIEWCHFQWSSMTPNLDFKVTIFWTLNNSKIVQESCSYKGRLTTINRCHFKWHLTTHNPDFKVTPILDVEYDINGRCRQQFVRVCGHSSSMTLKDVTQCDCGVPQGSMRQGSPILAFLPIFSYKMPKSTFLCAAYSPGVTLQNASSYSSW